MFHICHSILPVK